MPRAAIWGVWNHQQAEVCALKAPSFLPPFLCFLGGDLGSCLVPSELPPPIRGPKQWVHLYWTATPRTLSPNPKPFSLYTRIMPGVPFLRHSRRLTRSKASESALSNGKQSTHPAHQECMHEKSPPSLNLLVLRVSHPLSITVVLSYTLNVTILLYMMVFIVLQSF